MEESKPKVKAITKFPCFFKLPFKIQCDNPLMQINLDLDTKLRICGLCVKAVSYKVRLEEAKSKRTSVTL